MSDDSGVLPILIPKQRLGWAKSSPTVSLTLLASVVGALIGFGESRMAARKDMQALQQSVASLQVSVKEFGEKVDRLSEKGPEVDAVSLKNLDQRLTRLEKNWDDAEQIAGTFPRPRKRH